LLAAISLSIVIYNGCSENTPIEPNNITTTDGKDKDEGVLHTFCSTGIRIDDPNIQLPLYAGVGNRNVANLVGYVYFSNVIWTPANGGTMTVKYVFNDVNQDGIPDIYPWVATAVHFHIAATVAGIPHTNSGNPVPGQFEYTAEISPPYNQSIVTINNVVIPPGTEYAVAAHASAVIFGGVEGFNFYLPTGNVNMNVQYPGPSSYFKLNLSNAGAMNGSYECWCIDIGHYITPGTNYAAQLYSSYDPNLLVKVPFINNQIGNLDELDKVNYIVNHFHAGDIIQPLTDCSTLYGTPTALKLGDIQMAIWQIIDADAPPSPGSDWTQQKVNAIKCAAYNNGEGFVPGCNDKIIFIIVVNSSVQFVVGQVTIASIQVPCTTQGETCWADGFTGRNFPGANSWATYFLYKPVCTP